MLRVDTLYQDIIKRNYQNFFREQKITSVINKPLSYGQCKNNYIAITFQ